MTTWAAALDGFEARLARAEAVLERNEAADPLPPFEPPEVPAPLAAELLIRAQALLARGSDLEARFAAEQRRIRDELARLPRAPAPQSQAGRRFEFQA